MVHNLCEPCEPIVHMRQGILWTYSAGLFRGGPALTSFGPWPESVRPRRAYWLALSLGRKLANLPPGFGCCLVYPWQVQEMWKIRGIAHEIGDSVFVVRGILSKTVERFTIIRPRRLNNGWPVGSSQDGFAWASNGSEVIRIGKRGDIVDDLFSSRRIVPFEVGLKLERSQIAEEAALAPRLDAELHARLAACITITEKVRLLFREGWPEGEIAKHLNLRRQLVHEVILTPDRTMSEGGVRG